MLFNDRLSFRRLTPALLASIVMSCLVVAGCGSAATGLVASGASLTQVVVTRSQPSIPPQFRTPYQRTYTDPAILKTISNDITKRGISPGTTSAAPGCTGGSQWTVVLWQSDASTVKIDAYQCGNAASGNVTGDLAGFISDLEQLAW